MIRQVHDRIYVGSDADCFHIREGWAVVHACKEKCHRNAVGYHGNLPRTHPYYLVYKEVNNLYLNMIDPDTPMFMPPLFEETLSFVDERWNSGFNVLIHCNKGGSRAPSLALLFLAKRIGSISNESYRDAWMDYIEVDPQYLPSLGIQTYLTNHWEELI